jgi:hypothetical protein
MNNNQLQIVPTVEEEQLKTLLRQILQTENLHEQRALLAIVAADMAVDILDCAAVLLHLVQQHDLVSTVLSCDKITPPLSAPTLFVPSSQNNPQPTVTVASLLRPSADIYTLEPLLSVRYVIPTVKMVRYRLDIGKKHQLTVKELKKVLIEESGVDKNNINNVMIHGQYTLIELPDEMPQDIFQHLKTVEINGQKLNIKRVKARTKKQTNNRYRRGKQRLIQRGTNDVG